MQVEVNRQMSPFYSCVNSTDISEHLNIRYENKLLTLPIHAPPPGSLCALDLMPDLCTAGAA